MECERSIIIRFICSIFCGLFVGLAFHNNLLGLSVMFYIWATDK